MFGFFSKKLVTNVRYPPIKYYSSPSLSKKGSKFTVQDAQKHSFTISYLMNTCGLTLEKAVIASNKIHFETPDRPDSVIKLLQDHGFTKTQINKTIRIRPEFLLNDPKKTLLPKLEFFHSVGLSPSVLSKIVASYPSVLSYSLANHLIPSYKFIKSIVNDDDKAAMAIKNYPRILLVNVQKNIAPNIAVLRENGVPDTCISLLLTRHGSSLMQNCDKFKKSVKQVVLMGTKPSASSFVLAVQVTVVMTEVTKKRKVEIYKKWGWSETEIQTVFKKHPVIMNLSEKKINNAMEFLVNKMGMESAAIARNPSVLGLSLEKRIIPRCSVVQFLQSKGLKNRDLGLPSYLFPAEKVFLERYVTRYEIVVPELLSFYSRFNK